MSTHDVWEDRPNALLLDASPEAVMNKLTERVVTGSRMERLGYGSTRFSIVYQDRRKLTVSRRTYNFALFMFLMLFLFVPGFIYMMVARNKERITTVVTHRTPDGRTRVEITGNDEKAQRAFRRSLKEAYTQGTSASGRS